MKIYTSIKLKEVSLWRGLAEQWTEHEFIARWVSHYVNNVPDDAVFAKAFWGQNFEDISDSDVLIVYAQGEEPLRGSLVEVGFALALAVPVVVVGDHSDYGTWQHHAMVYKVKDFAEAHQLLGVLSVQRYVMMEG